MVHRHLSVTEKPDARLSMTPWRGSNLQEKLRTGEKAEHFDKAHLEHDE